MILCETPAFRDGFLLISDCYFVLKRVSRRISMAIY
jgi:hypothetical protein